MISRAGRIPAATVVALALTLSTPWASAQHARQTKEGAAIIVDGTVREVFRSARQSQVDYLVQIEVNRSEYGPAPADPRRVQAPAPGDQIYVHVFQGVTGGASGDGHVGLPAERTRVRAFLYARPQGGWEGAYPEWLEQKDAVAQNRGANDPFPPAEMEAPAQIPPVPPSTTAPTTAANGSILQKLGIRAEQVHVSNRLVLKVIDVAPDTPAAAAGLEPGDAVIGINGGFFTSLDQLGSAIAKAGPEVTLAVLDHRSGKTVGVKMNVGGVVTAEAPRPAPAPSPAPRARVLGVKTEKVRVGFGSSALKVTAVQEGSPAAKAGIEPGDILVDANGTPLSDPAHLTAAVQASGPVMKLKVRDTRTRRDIPVEVHLNDEATAGTSANPAPSPAPVPSPAPAPGGGGGGGTSTRALGLTVEAGTADLLPVVKVVAVQQGSPADKAGIEAGDAIVGLNDKVIFAPDLLNEALQGAGNAFTLSVLDVKTGKKTPVKVSIP